MQTGRSRRTLHLRNLFADDDPSCSHAACTRWGASAVARRPQAIKITPKLIEFQDHILRVPNIATVTIGPDPKRRRIALILFIVGAFSLWLAYQTTQYFGAMMGINPHSQTNTPGIVLTLIGIAAFLLGLYLFKYLALFISTSDGRFTVLVDSKYQFMRDVMERIREALLAGEEGNVYYHVNVQAERIERLDANSTVVSNSAGAVVAGGSMDGLSSLTSGASASAGLADLVSRAREQVSPVAGRAFQAAGELASRGRSMAEERIASMRQGSSGNVSANTVNVMAAAPGAIIAGGGMSMNGSQISTHGSIVNEFDSIVAALSQLHIAHRDEIIAYIEPVRDHLAGGPTPREDAKPRWAWFVANAASALSGVDGALAIIERVSRLLGLAR